MHQLTIFYDSRCPLCCYEMDKLIENDTNQLINLIDIYSNEFNELAPNISQKTALSIIHGIYQNKIIQGIDVNYWAWTLVGKKHRVILLKTPIIRQLAKLAYRLFAYFRHPISTILSKLFKLEAKTCKTGYCDSGKTTNHRR